LRRDNKLAPLLAIVGGAIVLIVAIVVASQISNGSKKSNSSTIATDSIAEMLSGIPQKGIALGNSNAKLTLVEFADPQCPGCGDFAKTVLPTLVQTYVRTGQLRIEYRGLHFIDSFVKNGPKDSERLLRLAEAAGFQNRLWDIVELEYENQGTENTGWATDALLKGLAQTVKGLNVSKVLASANTNAVVPNMEAAQTLADQSFKPLSTPSFLLGPTGAKPTGKFTGQTAVSSLLNALSSQLKK
jgi:protein-disulfide isomerase